VVERWTLKLKVPGLNPNGGNSVCYKMYKKGNINATRYRIVLVIFANILLNHLHFDSTLHQGGNKIFNDQYPLSGRIVFIFALQN
jgi:hypothetical protein